MESVLKLAPGQRVTHAEFGDGVIVDRGHDGYVKVFFRVGERQVPFVSLQPERSRTDRILASVEGSHQRLQQAWLAYEACALPLMANAAALTAAKIDLLPHQVVLTHRIATATPRRFLIADEVGLGKTIETALLLRELASRGELRRALMVVPAGLVNNWHRELNEVFNLNFEVFGSEGDVTDRKSNAFAKHHRLIASIDTLKRPTRVRKLLEAPMWDLVVFDEAHHITAYRSGKRVRKTANFKLAEALRDHARDLLMLSATPHQGDHFPFWMLIQLLDPTLFRSSEDMVENRHRLNTVVIRRTKADTCKADGSTLFARRWVHTESFVMSDDERLFYEGLCAYLEEGFALAKRQGDRGRGLGFVMAIFQKIAASSFAAVRRTLRRRLLMLTLHEAILRDRELNLDARQALLDEARVLIRKEWGFPETPIGHGQVDRVLADLKLKLVRRLDDTELELAADPYASEFAAVHAEDAAADAVMTALPEERVRIIGLLNQFPAIRETKLAKLLNALGTLWRQAPDEKVVIFATYLGTVEMLGREIEAAYPGQGVVVLRGGDHGAKLAAERRFRQRDGARVLVCTAAGREGINLQFARVLFNFDLPWNPMDVEQRIGRIHRYGQHHTAQVYNLVLSDTIEGRIFLLLDTKLQEIARALGKVDERGEIAEDFKTQILGQLSERLSYERLYQEALSDPELRRTRLELEAALSNANEARTAVFQLFQDLEEFNLDDYKPFANVADELTRLVLFLSHAVADQDQQVVPVAPNTFELRSREGQTLCRFTTDRELAIETEKVDLLGLDHPLIQAQLLRWNAQQPEAIGACAAGQCREPTVISSWRIETVGKRAEHRLHLLNIAVDLAGRRAPASEKLGGTLYQLQPAVPFLTLDRRQDLLHRHIEPMLRRDLEHQGLIQDGAAYSAELVAWVEMLPAAQA